jgi:Na+-driven multidrug efflux pump
LVITNLLIFWFNNKKILTHHLNSAATVEKMQSYLPFWALLVVSLSMYGIMNGAIKGLGLQNKAAFWTIFCFYLICLPLAFFFGFMLDSFTNHPYAKDLKGIKGLYVGFTIGLIITNIIYIKIIFFIDWR